jgi:NitT/TauT family transport system ATP-binding protein
VSSLPQVSLEDVAKAYVTRGDPIVALTEVSFSVSDGEFLAIVGPSGCGKSTLLRIILGIAAPTQGRVLLRGAPVAGPQPGLGMVFQAPVLMRWRTVLENVLLPIQVLDQPVREYEQRARDLIQLVGLAGFEDRYPKELSGGMQQRVSICRALIHDPSLLLMDEPFGALDALTREQMGAELLRIWAGQRKTVVFVTHDIEEAVFLADRVVVMTPRPGRLALVEKIALPRPRSLRMKTSPAFSAHVLRIRSVLGLIPEDDGEPSAAEV